MANGVFLTAAQARQNPKQSRTVFDEAAGISSVILDRVGNGYYSALVNDGTPMTQQSAPVAAVQSIDDFSSTFTIPAHGFNTGDAVFAYSSGELPSPLVVNVLYFVIYVSVDQIQLATTLQDAQARRPIYVQLSNGVTAIDLVDAGTGYTNTPVVTISGGDPTVNATALARLSTHGNIAYISVGTHGNGYHYPPSVSITAQGSGALAGSATFQLITASVNQGGQYYHVGDVLTVVGGSGTSATCVVTTCGTNGAVLAVTVSIPGNYSTLPSLTAAATSVLPGGGIGCTLDLNMGLNTIAVASGGAQYIAPPLVLISSGGGVNAQAQAQLTAGSVSAILVTDPGAGYHAQPTIEITSGQSATATPYIIPTGVGGISLLTNGGMTYTDPPAVTIAASGSGAAIASINMRITSASIVTGGGGSGYAVGDILIIAGGQGSDTATIRVNMVDSAGSILAWTLQTSGSYTQLPVMTYNAVFGGSGSAASFDLTAGLGSVTLSSGGSGYAAAPTIVITANDLTGYGASAYCRLTNDVITSVVVTAAGSGYTTAPSVVIDSGSGAAAVATLTPVGVNVVNIVDQGYGYTSASVYFTSMYGNGAEATAVVSGGHVVSIVVTNPGYGYSEPPAVSIVGNGTGATAVAVLQATSVASLSVTAAGNNYTAIPNCSIAGAATGNVSLAGTGIAQIIVTAGGQYYTSIPQVNVIPGAGEFAVPTQPTTSVIRGFSLQDIQIVDAGKGYSSAPTVTISAPSNLNGNAAAATATVGYGTGTMTLSGYPASRDYYQVWQNGQTINPDQTAPYADNMLTVINYFTNLGYVITRQTNPATNNTFQWNVKW